MLCLKGRSIEELKKSLLDVIIDLFQYIHVTHNILCGIWLSAW